MAGRPPISRSHANDDEIHARTHSLCRRTAEDILNNNRSPLEFFARIYIHERCVASDILKIAAGRGSAAKRSKVLNYLRTIMEQTRRMETDALFPVLKNIATPDDHFERHLEDTELNAQAANDALAHLEESGEDAVLDREATESLKLVASKLRTRAAIWNSVILPIARVRFDDRADVELSNRLCAVENEIKHGERQ